MGTSHASSAVKYVTEEIFDCSPELLFDCWTQPQHLESWWLTDGYVMEVLDNDLRQGGRLLYRHTSPAGDSYISLSLYEQVVKPHRLIVLSSFSNEAGDLIPPHKYPLFPRVLYLILTFRETEQGTCIIIEAMPFEGTEKENNDFLTLHNKLAHTYQLKFNNLHHYLSTF